jgi:hypothetical protein
VPKEVSEGSHLKFFLPATFCDVLGCFAMKRDISGHFAITVATESSSETRKQTETSFSLPHIRSLALTDGLTYQKMA